MSGRNSLLAIQVATVVVTGALVFDSVSSLSLSSIGTLAFLTALALGSSALRIQPSRVAFGFESAVAIPVVMLLRSVPHVFLPVFAGALIVELFRMADRRTTVLQGLFDASRLALAYLVAARVFLAMTVSRESALADASGYILLVSGYLAVVFFFETLIHFVERSDPRPVFEQLSSQLWLHLLLGPIVVVEVLVYHGHGLTGLGLAWLPVLLVAHTARQDSENRRQRLELDSRNRILSVVTGSELKRVFEPDSKCLEGLVDQLSQVATMKACAVVTWEIESTVCRYGDCSPSDQAILRWVEASRFAGDAPKDAHLSRGAERTFPLATGVEANQVVVGIQTAEVIYGVLIFESTDATIMRPEVLELFRFLAGQTALAVQDQILRQHMREKTSQLEKQAETMAAILEVSNELIGQVEVDEILDRIAQSVRRSLGFDIVLIALRDSRTDDFVRRAQAGLDDVWEEVRQKRVPAQEIRTFFVDDFRISHSYFVSHATFRRADYDLVIRQDDPSRQEWHALDMLIVPLTSGEELIGYVSVREPADGKVPTLEKIRTLEVFANQAVTALQSARQYEEIRNLTLIDTLTPAYNHRYFQEALRKEVHRHERSGHSFALAMIDVDDFKVVNDTWGHPVGDIVLKGIVDEILINVRDIDIVARYGGEEFVVIFPEMPSERAREVAARLRLMVAAREFIIASSPIPIRVTISVGVAGYPFDGADEVELIARADLALYEAKRRGKNHVVMAGEIGSATTSEQPVG